MAGSAASSFPSWRSAAVELYKHYLRSLTGDGNVLPVHVLTDLSVSYEGQGLRDMDRQARDMAFITRGAEGLSL